MKSIRSRLAGGLIFSLIIFLIVQWLLIGTSIRYLSEAYVATRLEHDAQSLLAALDFKVDPVTLNSNIVDAIYKQPFSGHYYKIKTRHSEFRSRSLWDTNLPIAELGLGQSRLSHAEGPQNQMLLVFHTTYKKDQDLIFISVAEDLTGILKDIQAFRWQHTIISIVILSILVLIQGYIVKRNLKPLDTVRRDLENLEKGVIDQLSENVPEEIFPLVKELNHQLIAIRKRLDRSRNATGNLAHALKTPLTLIMQVATGDELKQYPDIKNKLLQHSEAIQQSIERELKRARMAGSNVVGTQIDLLAEVNDLVQTLSAMYKQKNLSINIDIPQTAVCNIDRQDMLEILGNIMENAYKWAKHNVQVSVAQNDQTLITVEDDGPGHDPDEMKKLIGRGERADEKVAGHGLGLSIVSEIIKEYQGSLEFSRSADLGGLCVSIRFPNGE
jgi:signal transduction histidine kinase